MRRSDWLAGLVALFAGALGAGVGACVISGGDTSDCNTYPHEGCPQFTGTGGQTSSSSSTGGMGTGGVDSGPPPSCIPDQNTMPVDDSCGVFVSSSLGSDMAGDGSKANPYASITKALADGKGKPLYLCGEGYDEAVAITAGVTIYGALDCTKAWAHDPSKKSTLISDVDTIPLTISGSTTVVDVSDLSVTAKTATKDGGSSIAALVAQATVSFTRCDFTAGDGKAGAPGAPFQTSATSGVMGNPGKAACSAGQVLGGDAVTSMCMPTDSVSGLGGIGAAASGGNGTDGQPGTTMNAGKGETGSPCSPGGVGDTGGNGNPGAGAAMTDLGTLAAGGFTPAPGGPGQPGKPGQGGGGGGGAKGGTGSGKCTDSTTAGGASGGSGGSGGCAGQGGLGGNGGGSSIAIASINATLTFTNVTLNVGMGGPGGDGGMGQSGGNGGDPGPAGTAKPMFANLNDACPGGKGGNGGNGGQGGGGRGGHALGIAYTGKPPAPASATTWKVATPGTANMGGAGDDTNGNPGDGAPGVAAEMQQFP